MTEYLPIPVPPDPELRVNVYYDGYKRGVTPAGRFWSYWCLDGNGPGLWQGFYRLGDLRLCPQK